MNQKVVKQLRKIVKMLNLPNSIEEYTAVEYVKGEALIKNGILTSGNKQPISAQGQYKSSGLSIRPYQAIDHLKKCYSEDPKNCVPNFIKSFEAHHKKMVEKYPKVFTKASENDNVPDESRIEEVEA
jgi:hypothetical protein